MERARIDRETVKTPTSTATTCAPSAGDATVGGPAPYRHSYTYDAAGNRAGDVRHATGTIGDAAITQATTYVPMTSRAARTPTS